ncbi:UDP-N-Acetylglucosamine 2-epimerase [Marininema mesophilum]|uniref:UDP-N-acetylglucosamine 2-epimerase (non-hydrolyzing) n=1 Tax=Marininema mesophilum TaxID=1048340 RepID=A0A1H3BII3_9BACL|nr:UDP-N-acetylglucosamine 2-epimerase (non-hydrolyzing) [Marininema mesophilum]SDX41770.1 UDP-N-Acetylglucosamine 2-epimerase [Marininema mesophilum]
MKSLKILAVFGTRPEAIKMAPVIHRLYHESNIEVKVCVTGQHREMVSSVLEVFGICTDFNLDVMAEQQSLDDIAARILERLPGIMEQVQPHMTIVQGDTTSAFIAGLVSFHQRVPVGHIEAGLRTTHSEIPFPEEMNRRLLGRLSSLHFSPTLRSARNLIREGVDVTCIHVTGNTIVDAMRWIKHQPSDLTMKRYLKGSPYILITSHRREHWGEPMQSVFRGVLKLVKLLPNGRIVFPTHPNPALKEAARRAFEGRPEVVLMDPMPVVDFHFLAANASLIVSDSGGIQEEVPSFNVPLLITRMETERPEVIEGGWGVLTGCDEDRIFSEGRRLLNEDKRAWEGRKNPFGDGRASDRIVAAIWKYFNRSSVNNRDLIITKG